MMHTHSCEWVCVLFPFRVQSFGLCSEGSDVESVWRDFDLGITTRFCGVDGCNNPFYMLAQHGPFRVTKHNERNLPNRQVLLVSNVFVGSDKHGEAESFGGIEQRAVVKFVPASLRSGFYGVGGEKGAKRQRSSLIEENQHQRKDGVGAFFRLLSANSSTALTC